MLDKKLAQKLKPLVNNRQLWVALLEHLHNLKSLELQALVVATSEQEMFRCQGKINSLVRLEQLKDQVAEAISRKIEE
jgi:hypothetical protein